MTTTATTTDDALRAAVADLPKLPWLSADFVEADCRIGDDHDGDPAVWVRLIAHDTAVERPGFFEEVLRTGRRVRDHLRGTGLLGDRWAFLDLCTETERRELREGAARES